MRTFLGALLLGVTLRSLACCQTATLSGSSVVEENTHTKQIYAIRNALAAAAREGAVQTGNGIGYNGGPLITSAVSVYYIWYGNWNGNTALTLLESFARDLGGSTYYNINTTYTDGSGTPVQNAVIFGGSMIDNYSQGANLSDSQIWQVVDKAISTGKLPTDPNGVYFVLSSVDVNATSGFCSNYCGWHAVKASAGTRIKFAFVGDSSRCPGTCSTQSVSPNGNVGADGMASVIAHELSESVTDPNQNGWFDNAGLENADKCAWNFGATFPLANGSHANVTLGNYNYLLQQIWVNASGGYCSLQYLRPLVNSITPAAAAAGQTFPVTLTGRDFGSGATVAISGTGVIASNVVVVGPTQITTNLAVDGNASLGARNVTVASGGAVSAPVVFTVKGPSFTLTSVSPSTGVAGTTIPITFTGTNFAIGAAVQMMGSGAAVSGVTVVSATKIQAQLTIDPSAAPGNLTFTVSMGSSVTTMVSFEVTSSIVTLTAVNPAFGVAGTSVPVKLTGTNFVSDAALQISGSGVMVSGVTVVSATQLNAELVISKAASPGSRSVTVSTGSSLSSSLTFAITASVAKLNAPVNGSSGGTATFQIDYSHGNGSADLSSAYILISHSGNGVNGCYIEYNQGANFLRVANDAATAFPAPVVPGSFGTSGNSQCAVSASNSSVERPNPSVLRLNANVVFRPGFNGTYNVYGLAFDLQGNSSGLVLLGTFIVSATSATSPAVLSCFGCTGAGGGGTFTEIYSSSLGPNNIDSAYLLISPSASGTNACYVQYIRSTNQLRVANDAGTGFSKTVPVGTTGELGNSQCWVDTGTTTVTSNGNNLTVNYQVTFTRPAFNGARNVYGLVYDVTGLNSGLVPQTTFVVQ